MLGGGDAQERAARQALAAWPGMSANIECEHHSTYFLWTQLLDLNCDPRELIHP